MMSTPVQKSFIKRVIYRENIYPTLVDLYEKLEKNMESEALKALVRDIGVKTRKKENIII